MNSIQVLKRNIDVWAGLKQQKYHQLFSFIVIRIILNIIFLFNINYNSFKIFHNL